MKAVGRQPRAFTVLTRIQEIAHIWRLAQDGRTVDSARDILERWLATDSGETVRFAVARGLGVLVSSDRERLDRILAKLKKDERSPVVWGGVADASNEWTTASPSLAADVVGYAIDLVAASPALGIFVPQLVELALHNEASSVHRLRILVSDPKRDDAVEAARVLMSRLARDAASEWEANSIEVARAHATTLTTAAAEAITKLQSAGMTNDPSYPRIARVLEMIVRCAQTQIRSFADGVRAGNVSMQRLASYVAGVQPLLAEASGTGEAALIHHEVETLQARRTLDARAALLRLAELVELGKRGGYEFDDFGVNETMGFIEAYLTDDRTLLQDDEQCRKAVLNVLDVFVGVGWSRARRLALELSDIFR